MVLSCRMWKMTCIPFVFPAEQTRRISRFLCCSSFCNIPWIFFRFWQVNRDIHLTKFCIRCPLFILYNPVCADIVCCLAEMIIKVGCSLWRYLIFFLQKLFLPQTEPVSESPWFLYRKDPSSSLYHPLRFPSDSAMQAYPLKWSCNSLGSTDAFGSW